MKGYHYETQTPDDCRGPCHRRAARRRLRRQFLVHHATSSSGPSGVLTLDNESGGTWACQFNPFNLSDIGFSLGNIYEPLMFVNALQSGKVTPWLATSYAWSNGNKTLTFTIRKGVKWSNGDPLTPADVVYTFNLLKAYHTLDVNSVWSVLSSVTSERTRSS